VAKGDFRKKQNFPLSTDKGRVALATRNAKLACRVQPKRTQVETQYWGNPEVARLEGTPAMDVGHMNVVLKWMYL